MTVYRKMHIMYSPIRQSITNSVVKKKKKKKKKRLITY
eukprot:CAMPEP_0116959954 /NCGR_PEP_ID=MMETSP0467-20121206/45649_1 /TAXON_ID=283647 /ORGANISM="Mesodinium pulex, Strain SPMC105" /LENGTH=37 /DNA_ID= /DNA_START= /DNA_END= /DNA_ORIENTATION=